MLEHLRSDDAALVIVYLSVLSGFVAAAAGVVRAGVALAWWFDKRKRRERIRGIVYAAERRAHLNGDRPAIPSPPPSKGHA